MPKYRYETHCHTAPVSKCARADARDTVEFYKSEGYDGLFITNHFLDGNINIPHDSDMSYAEKIEFYFSDYEEALMSQGLCGALPLPKVRITMARRLGVWMI